MTLTAGTAPRLAVVCNPAAGRGRGARVLDSVVAHWRSRGIAVRTVAGRDAAETAQLIDSVVARGVDGVVAVGGDGTVHLALQAVAGTATGLGIVPAGTGNDLAAALGVPEHPVAAADAVATALDAGWARPVDAVRAVLADGTGRWYACVLGAGFDSAVNERANTIRWPAGPRKYDVAVLAELRTFSPLPFTLVLDGVEHQLDAMLVAVGNAPSYGAGMRICPTAVLDDGLLDVTVLGAVSIATLMRLLPQVYRGTHVRHPAVTTFRAREVSLFSPGVTAYVDGERLGPLGVTATAVPGALKVLLPGAPARAT